MNRVILTALYCLTLFFFTAESAKIVGLVAAKNEEAIIEQCLTSLALYTDAIVFLDDASTDNTLSIAQKLANACKIESIITKDKWHRDESGDKQKLLTAGRKIGGTHFMMIDADEMFTANCLDGTLKQKVLSLKPGECLQLYWISLWHGIEKYSTDKSFYKEFIFCDDGKSNFNPLFLHTPRVPENLRKRQRLSLPYGLLHFQFVNEENFLIKQAWYQCLERIRAPRKSTSQINHLLWIN